MPLPPPVRQRRPDRRLRPGRRLRLSGPATMLAWGDDPPRPPAEGIPFGLNMGESTRRRAAVRRSRQSRGGYAAPRPDCAMAAWGRAGIPVAAARRGGSAAYPGSAASVLVSRGLVSRGLVSRGLVSRGLVSRGLVSWGLVS